MPTGVLVLLLFAGLFVWALSTPNRIESAVRKAVRQKSPAPILQEIERKPADFHGTFFTQAINLLWKADEHHLAAMLTLEFVPTHPNKAEGHRWVEFIHAQDPDLADQIFSPHFMANVYNPSIESSGGG